MLARVRLALTLVIVLAAAARPAWPQAVLDVGTMKLYGGTYMSDCKNPLSPRVTVREDSLVFIHGDKRVAGSIVLDGISYFGERPPENFSTTLEGEHPSGQHLYLLVFTDANGPYITIDADPKLLAQIGKPALALEYRRCSGPAKRASVVKQRDEVEKAKLVPKTKP